jgi:phage shock protein PspC (stress-responsive transcriptional regulator)
MIGGIAGGIAENLGIDPTIVRIGWVVLALVTNGVLVLVYFLLLFLLPEAPEGSEGSPDGDRPAPLAGPQWTAPATARTSGPSTGGRSGGLVVGAILVLVGGYFLVRQYLPAIDLGLSWPFVAIALGVILIVAALRPGGRSG